jgi:hypothetical protein
MPVGRLIPDGSRHRSIRVSSDGDGEVFVRVQRPAGRPVDDPQLTRGRSQPAIIGPGRAMGRLTRGSRYLAGALGGAAPVISALTMRAREFRASLEPLTPPLRASSRLMWGRAETITRPPPL